MDNARLLFYIKGEIYVSYSGVRETKEFNSSCHRDQSKTWVKFGENLQKEAEVSWNYFLVVKHIMPKFKMHSRLSWE